LKLASDTNINEREHEAASLVFTYCREICGLEVLDLDVEPTPKSKKSARESGIFNKEHPLTLESRAGVGKMDREI
jgi:hypothetical protein